MRRPYLPWELLKWILIDSTGHARVFNGIVLTSGQIGADTKGVVVSDSVAEQAEQMIKNLEAVLSDAGSGLDRIMNANIFLSDSGYYAEFNAVYTRVFTSLLFALADRVDWK